MAQYIELSQYNGTPITDTFDVFDGWMPSEDGLKIAIGAGNFAVQGTSIGLKATRLIAAASRALIFSGKSVVLLKSSPLGVWIQTVFSQTVRRNTVSAEKVRRATAQPRITGV